MTAAVDLWTQALEASPAEIAQWRTLLAPDERARADRFHFDRDRRRYTVARGRLRQLLARYTGLQPAAIEFEYNSFGKPSLPGNGLQFNLSHSHELAVYAFTAGIAIGVDVEHLERPIAQELIPERFFAPGEVRDLRSLPQDQQHLAFYTCWTRKEAYVKARAEGLSIPLDSFEVTLTPGEPPRFLRGAEGWSLQSFRIGASYIGAVAAACAGIVLDMHQAGHKRALLDHQQ